eukprot:COSAG06_NODE_50201_length_320_cov_0.927602_1_plen_46_part_10
MVALNKTSHFSYTLSVCPVLVAFPLVVVVQSLGTRTENDAHSSSSA